MSKVSTWISKPLLMCRSILSLLCFSLVLVSCKDPVLLKLRTKNGLNQESAQSQNLLAAAINAGILKVVIQSLVPLPIGKHVGLKINVKREATPDYYQFFICSYNQQGVQEKCEPSSENPGHFVAASHEFHTPPYGLIQVYVRACVRTEKAVNPNVVCGPYAGSSLEISPTEDKPMQDLLAEQARLVEESRKNCGDFFDNTKAYYEKIKNKVSKANMSEQKMIEYVRKQLEMGKDLTCELVYSSLYENIDGKVDSEESSEKEKRGWTPKAITLLSVGIASTVAGVGLSALAVHKYRNYRAATRIRLIEDLPTHSSSEEKAIIDAREAIKASLNDTQKSLSLAQNQDYEHLVKIYNQFVNTMEHDRQKLEKNLASIEAYYHVHY